MPNDWFSAALSWSVLGGAHLAVLSIPLSAQADTVKIASVFVHADVRLAEEVLTTRTAIMSELEDIGFEISDEKSPHYRFVVTLADLREDEEIVAIAIATVISLVSEAGQERLLTLRNEFVAAERSAIDEYAARLVDAFYNELR